MFNKVTPHKDETCLSESFRPYAVTTDCGRGVATPTICCGASEQKSSRNPNSPIVRCYLKKAVVFLALLPIYFYRTVLSPLSKTCQFYPSCSLYTLQSIKRFGAVRGYYMGGRRLMRCHPFGKRGGGFDPVPYKYSGGAKWVI